MATRGAFLFEISPYPGRKGPVVTAVVYNHWGGDPREIVEIVLEHWEEALDRLANDPSKGPNVPQVSGAQVMMGLMLADVGFQFRLKATITAPSRSKELSISAPLDRSVGRRSTPVCTWQPSSG